MIMKKLVFWSVASGAVMLTLLCGVVTAPAHASAQRQSIPLAPVSTTITLCNFPTASMQISGSQYFYISPCATTQLINMLVTANATTLQKIFGYNGWMLSHYAQATLPAVLGAIITGSGIWLIFNQSGGACAGLNLPFVVVAGNAFSTIALCGGQ
jgi:hypothetical protein